MDDVRGFLRLLQAPTSLSLFLSPSLSTCKTDELICLEVFVKEWHKDYHCIASLIKMTFNIIILLLFTVTTVINILIISKIIVIHYFYLFILIAVFILRQDERKGKNYGFDGFRNNA